MNHGLLASAALALSLAATAIPAAETTQVGALEVQQVSTSGKPVIFIPGLACGPWAWEETAQRLKGSNAVYLLRLPGFDGSKPVPGTTLDSLVKDLETLIVSRKLVRPVLVGHSLGGTLSLKFATEHSNLIAGVVAVDGLATFPGTEAVTDRKPLAERTRKQFGGQTQEQFAASQLGYMKQIGTVDPALAEKLAGYSSRSDVTATAEFAAQLFELDLRPQLGAITVPVVEISPYNELDFAAMGIDEDKKTAYYRTLLDGVKQLEVVSISPARHFVMFDQPEKFAAALDAAMLRMRKRGK